MDEQEIKADSLYRLYKNSNSQLRKLDLLSALVAEIHYSDSALQYYQEAISLARLLDRKELLAQNLNRLGVYFRNMNLQEEALVLYEEALEVSKSLNIPTQIGHSLNNIGQMYYLKEFYEEALEYYLEAEKEFKKVNDLNGLGYNYTGMSLVLSELGMFREAIAKIDNAIQIREDLGLTRQVIVSKFNKADILMSIGIYDEAEQHIQRLYQYGIENDKVRAIHALGKLVELKIKTGKFDEAVNYAERAEVLHHQKPNSEAMIDIYQLMNQMHFTRGDSILSNKYQGLLLSERNIIKNERTKNHLAGITIKNQREEIEFLNKQQQLIQENARIKIYLSIGLFIIILIVSIGFFIIFRAWKREKINLDHLSLQKNQLEIQAHQLQKSNLEKDKIFSIIAHDLRSPLNSLTGLLKLVQEKNLTKKEFTDYVEMISKNLGNNNTLLENLLLWSRSQMKKLEPKPVKFNLNDLIQRNMDLLPHGGYFKNQKLINRIVDEFDVMADQNMIDIVLRNLLSNAMKFTRPGDQIVVSASSRYSKVKVTIRDRGVGIKPEDIDKLFKTDFYTTAGTNQESGTGIGLMLCKEIIEMHNGKIWVESEYGHWTDFFFEIPKAT
ncbi:ATP-binding protein [Belliella kenyensis]|uniref:histidine kinase n=1 Tax=Belliella kenyensis TaxID=1472724 RepID=A0ABV8ENH4_9BACT|nr:ATP-binding protein [Belliella kenyensis]MCH7400444.1 ATP-binding protein [Belliella kenyensis]MDN3604540.1 ATP-binding protein [Belliella kenyensis]